ncbi:MAG: hypothetical protein JWP89_408 [Schlesneria sp.]|nr:hypothetical protein [Schlesneria sp.]
MPSTPHGFANRFVQRAVARQQELSRNEMRRTNASGTLPIVEEAKFYVASHRRVARGALVMFVFRRVAAVLLIAVLASSTMSSPALRHIHAITDHRQPQREAKPLSHGHPHRHSHSHAHSHGHHDHSERATSAPMQTVSTVEHIHLVWLGFDLTLPALPANSSDRSDTGDEWAPLLGEMVQAQVEVVTDDPNLSGGNTQAMAFVILTLPHMVPSAPPDVSQVCDTARRERSGVLRI